MNVYDFDKTIYDGDSTVDFYLYCVRTQPRVLKALPCALVGFAGYGLKLMEKTAMKERFYTFLRHVDDVDATVAAFWQANAGKVKSWYAQQQRPDDVIISAGPTFLLEPISAQLGIGTLMASQVDAHTGAYTGTNCHGAEKVRRFREVFGEAPIEEFYSDSLSDSPLAELAERAFLVKGDVLEAWPR